MDARQRGELKQQIVERVASSARDIGRERALLEDALYHERFRARRGPVRGPAERALYSELAAALRRDDVAPFENLLQGLARCYVDEVFGPASDRAYRAATTVAPVALAALLNLKRPWRLVSRDLLQGLSRQLLLQGEVEMLRALSDRATFVVVPTHASNLDPMVMGYALSLLGLPRFLFGGSAHLFVHPAVSFFLHTMGAYRVDRTRKAQLYKQVLKEYVTSSLERGQHHIFFPGGTRSRSGAVETHLKKGLLGTAIRAFIGSLRGSATKPRPIVIVPCTISYKLVLEAETLIDDHLAEEGQARYIIDDDEFTKPARLLSYLSNLVGSGGKIVVTFGPPLDVVGHRIDESGRSHDARGRPVSLASYVSREGEPCFDEQRDMEYTRELAEALARLYQTDNVVMSTHVVARALFRLMRRADPQLDLYRLLRTGGSQSSFSTPVVEAEAAKLLDELRRRAGRPRLAADVTDVAPREMVTDALEHYRIYHHRPAAIRRGDRIFHENRNLLLYYANRVRPYWEDRRAAAITDA